VEGDDTWRLFLPFELVWAGGRVGRAVARATAWWWHRSEAMTSLVARRREELRRQRLQEEAGPPVKVLPRPAYREVDAPKDASKAPARSGPHDQPIGAPQATPTTALAPTGAPPAAE